MQFGFCGGAEEQRGRGENLGYSVGMDTEKIPIACNMYALNETQRGRYENLRRTLLATVCQIREEQNGYAFCWNHEASTLVQIAEWVSLERLCCPFLQFNIEVLPADGPIWLKLGDGPEVKDFLKHEFAHTTSISPPGVRN
jgi:hypothetical protein